MKLDATNLRISVEEQPRWRRRLSVTIPADVVQAEERQAARQLASRARLKGFRKGRVPAKVIESRFAGALRQEAVDKLVGSAYREALEARALRPISEGRVEELNYEPQQDLTFSISFDVEPEVSAERFGGFAVERPVRAVTDESVDRVLERIREQNGVWQPVEEGRPESGDLVSVSITRLGEEGEPADAPRDYDVVLGRGDAIADIEDAILTLETGAEGDFDIAFPDDFPDEARRGDHERVRIALTSRRVMDLPDLDDDLARQVGEFETLDELRTKVREDMEKEATQQADSIARSRLLDLVVEANPFEVPESMVERYVDGVLGDSQRLPPEQLGELKTQLHPEAERAVKRILMVDHLAEARGLQATEDDIDARIAEIADANGTDPSKVYAELQKAGRLEAMERDLTEKAVLDFLFEQSEINDTPEA